MYKEKRMKSNKILDDFIKDNKEKEEIVKACYKFIPYQMFNMLNKKDITKIKLEDQTDSEAAILTVNTVLLSDLIYTMETKEIFAFINRILSRIVPIISIEEGIIEKFTDTGLTALFTESNQKALKGAISICEAMDEIDKNIRFSVGLCYGYVMIGIVGHEERQSLITLSSHTGLSLFLQSIASKYNSKILVTHDFLKKIDDYDKKYSIRFIGYFYIRSTNTLEKIYDVFDGDSIEHRQIKKKTRIIFEQGVTLYTMKKFEEARLHFIEVLKAYRMDSASKEYLYLCDHFIQAENREDAEAYIETC